MTYLCRTTSIGNLDSLSGLGKLYLLATSTIDVPSRAALSAGASVDVIFRPEDVTTSLDPSESAIECAVERIVFQGGMSECQLRFGSALLRTVVHPAVGAEPGDRAWIAIHAERCVLLTSGQV